MLCGDNLCCAVAKWLANLSGEVTQEEDHTYKQQTLHLGEEVGKQSASVLAVVDCISSGIVEQEQVEFKNETDWFASRK